MDASGAKSQLPSLVAAVTIALVLLFFTDLLAFLPNAALAGIVANAVLSLIEVHELRELWRMRRSEFWIAAVCLLSVLALGPLRAVMIAFLLSTIDVIRRASRPETAALRGSRRRQPLRPRRRRATPSVRRAWSSIDSAPRSTSPTRPSSSTRSSELVDRAPTPVRWFVLDAEAMVDVDTTGAGVLRQAITLLAGRGITFAVSRADRSFRSWLEKYELMKLIDQKRFYPTNRHAAEAFREDQASSGSETHEREHSMRLRTRRSVSDYEPAVPPRSHPGRDR